MAHDNNADVAIFYIVIATDVRLPFMTHLIIALIEIFSSTVSLDRSDLVVKIELMVSEFHKCAITCVNEPVN